MPLSPLSSPLGHVPSSARTGQKQYSSRRLQAHREKRKAEREAEDLDSDDTDTDGEDVAGSRSKGSKRTRREVGSPSPKTKGVSAMEGRTSNGIKGGKEVNGGGGEVSRQPPEEVMAIKKTSTSERMRRQATRETDTAAPAEGRRTTRSQRTRCQTPEPLSSSMDEEMVALPHSNADDKISISHTNVTDDDSSAAGALKAAAAPAPRTPPRLRPSRALSAHTSPRDLSALFELPNPSGSGSSSPRAPASPSGKLVRPGGMRRMLTKAQSLGDALGPGSDVGGGDGSPFSRISERSERSERSEGGEGVGRGEAGPSTPSKSVLRTMSMPESPSSVFSGSPRQDEMMGFGRGGIRLSDSHSGAGGRKATRTYGRSRTFLEEVKPAGEGSTTGLGGLEESGAGERAETYAELRQRYGVDNADTGASGSGSFIMELQQARPPQPISDMRSKGENRRFLDEVGYLVAGLQDTSATLALRRASSVDVLRSMQDEAWAQKVYICGQSEILWEGLMSARKEGDEVIEAISILYLTLCATSPIGLEAIMQGHVEEVLEHLQRGIMRDGPVDKAFELSTKLPSMAAKISVQWDTEAPTPRRYASWLLNQIFSDRSPITNSPSSIELVTAIADALAAEMAEVANRFELHDTGLPLVREHHDFDLEHLSLCLKSVSSLIRRDEGDLELFAARRVRFAATLSDIATLSVAFVATKNARETELSADRLLEVMQIQVFFSKISTAWAARCLPSAEATHTIAWVILQRERVASALTVTWMDIDASPFIDKPSQSSRVTSTSEDILCLALSLLVTALSSHSLKVPDWLASIEIGSLCTASNGCTRKCRCGDRTPLPVHLARVYTLYKGDETETGPVIRGYLALLLSKALTARSIGRESVQEALECDGQGGMVRELRGALEALQEIHLKAGRQLDEGEEGVESDAIVREAIEQLGGW